MRVSTAIVIAAITVLAACPDKSKPSRERSEILMDTLVLIKADGCGEDALSTAFEEIRRVESLMSRFDPESELSRLNRSRGEPVEVSERIWEVLLTAERIHKSTGGGFDPTISPAFNLWESETSAPSGNELREIKKLTGWDKVKLSHGRNVSMKPGMSLNLDGIAKGYAADRAALALKKLGCTRALVNAGGDIRLYSEKDETPWSVAIETGNLKLVLRNAGVATSALDKRRLTAGGKKYPHILDPSTLKPIKTSVISATAVADTAAGADGWATAAMVMGKDVLKRADKKNVALAVFTEKNRWKFNRAWNERLRYEPLSPPDKP